MADPWKPRYLVLHDYAVPKGVNLGRTAKNPYNALVYPDGYVRYRNPPDPYGVRAPHAHNFNSQSIGLSYAGPYGGTPTPAALDAIRGEYAKIQKLYPGIKTLSHGEAYKMTRGTPYQASKHGRDLKEASWRTLLTGATALAQTASAAPPDQPVPMAQRGLVAHAGLASPTTDAPLGAVAPINERMQFAGAGAAGMSVGAPPVAPSIINRGAVDAPPPASQPAPVPSVPQVDQQSRMALGGPQPSSPSLPERNPIRGAAGPLGGYRPATWENINGTMTPKFQPSPVAGAAGGMTGAAGRKKFMGLF